MKSLYNKVYKNYQVNLGIPFQVKMPVNLQGVRPINLPAYVEDEVQEDAIEDGMGSGTAIEAEDVLARAREEAEFIIKEAHYEAARIMDEAQSQAEQMKAEVLEEACNKGYQDGYNEAKGQYEHLINEAEEIKKNALVEYDKVLAGIESDAVNMILEIAKKVIGEEISLNKENILYLVKQAFEKCSNKEDALLRVSSEDYEYIMENKEQLASMIEGIGEFEIRKDGSLKAGACIVETPFGSIDAGLQTKLSKIEEAFRQLIRV